MLFDKFLFFRLIAVLYVITYVYFFPFKISRKCSNSVLCFALDSQIVPLVAWLLDMYYVIIFLFLFSNSFNNERPKSLMIACSLFATKLSWF